MTYNTDTHTENLIRKNPGTTIKNLVPLFKDGRHYHTVRASVNRLIEEGRVVRQGYGLYVTALLPVDDRITTIKGPRFYAEIEEDEWTREIFRDVISVGKFIAGSDRDTKLPESIQTIANFQEQVGQFLQSVKQEQLIFIYRFMMIAQLVSNPEYFQQFTSVDTYPKAEFYESIKNTFKKKVVSPE